jgi:hypothetical protein
MSKASEATHPHRPKISRAKVQEVEGVEASCPLAIAA